MFGSVSIRFASEGRIPVGGNKKYYNLGCSLSGDIPLLCSSFVCSAGSTGMCCEL